MSDQAKNYKPVVIVDKNGNPVDITRTSYTTIKVGDVAGGNYAEFEDDGTLKNNGDATTWDDIKFPLFGQRLDVSSGRIDYNFEDCTVDFENNARYPEEPICILGQLSLIHI